MKKNKVKFLCVTRLSMNVIDETIFIINRKRTSACMFLSKIVCN
jgi:hypothetical protein